MKEAATMIFKDEESNDEVIAIVRYDENRVGLCLSLKSGSDMEVLMTKADARKLIKGVSPDIIKGVRSKGSVKGVSPDI